MSARPAMPDPNQPEQFEFAINGKRLREGEHDLGFQLIPETAIDFARLAAEKAAEEERARAADAAQLKLF